MLSIVIPVCNEVESLPQLHAELHEVAASEGYALDVIFVDDGSTDGSWDVITRLAAADPQVRGLRFRRNFGKAAALSAGFGEARGDVIMTLDSDLQDDPHEIPRFLAALEGGLDCVSGWKRIRRDPWHKVAASRAFNALVGGLTGVPLHDHNCGMKCYRRMIFDDVQIYGELHRFVPVLAAAKGYRLGELVIHHRPRQYGRSKYGFGRLVKGFLDLLTVKFLTGFSHRPQHLLGSTGLVSFGLGLLGLLHLAISGFLVWMWPGLRWLAVRELPAVVFSMGLTLLGVQLMSTGLIAELIVAQRGPRNRQFSIAERVGATATAAHTVTASTPSS